MPKAEKGTPKVSCLTVIWTRYSLIVLTLTGCLYRKDIANRIKSKGLQKLKFYCQMCEKQCRDANGFKCHLTSENHLRQMKIFSDNAGGILDTYSKDFEKMFINTLRMRHGTKQVNANNIYQEVISDKFHIHMNATHWATLSEFVQYLGKTGKCVVEETERGWFVSYIERDVSILARNEAMQRREQAEKAAEEAQAKRMELQRIEAAKELDRVGGTVHVEATKMERTQDDQPIKVNLANKSNTSKKTSKPKLSAVFGDDNDEDDDDDKADEEAQAVLKPEPPPLPSHTSQRSSKERPSAPKRKEDRSENAPKAKRSKLENNNSGRKDYWLYRNIIVRVISKKLENGKFFKRKAVVDKVIDKYTAEVEVLDTSADARDGGDILRLFTILVTLFSSSKSYR